MSNLSERPGITLEIKMLEQGWTYLAFCQSTAIPLKYLRQIIDGTMPIDEAIDDSLCKIFHQDKGTWLKYQLDYLCYEADKLDGQSIESNKSTTPSIYSSKVQCNCRLIPTDQRQHNHPWSCIEALKIQNSKLEEQVAKLEEQILGLWKLN